jgi:hypothetical protein
MRTDRRALALAWEAVTTLSIREALMLIAKHYEEPAIYRAAAAFEGAGNWKKM